MYGRWKWLAGTLGLMTLALCLVSLGKNALNDFEVSWYDTYNHPHTASSAAARRAGLWVADFRIEPKTVTAEGKSYEFAEAWLEAAYEPHFDLVWSSSTRRAGWSYLCIRPKTAWHQEEFLYTVTPQDAKLFDLPGLGSKGRNFTQSGNDYYFQKVPTDLAALKLTVSTYGKGEGKDILVGTATLTRVE